MFATLIKKIFGTSNDRLVRSFQPYILRINELEPEYSNLSDAALRAQTDTHKLALLNGKTLDDILPEAFATVREASKRVLGMRHFDVQLIGGIVLHQGMIAEMKTGEGKTLVATLPTYLNALSGKGVHVVTVNDYLAERDSKWMGKVYEFLGLSVGCILNQMNEDQRRQAYNSDITYGTNNEFGFDYLRDNLKVDFNTVVQREFNFAIVDEVDSILIDEARTPLIISGATDNSLDLYKEIDKVVRKLNPEDYEVDDKNRSTILNDKGHDHIERLLKETNLLQGGSDLYDHHNIIIMHHVNQALRAHKNFRKDVEYMVKNDQVMLIDEFTGRTMEGRRFSDGLHQALEAKEGVAIQKENQTLASITFQNYFRMYPKLAGMTGTAMTEAAEFEEIYNLKVASIPTHLPVARIDEDDVIYKSMQEKYDAIISEIKEIHKTGQPILIGTVSIEKSEEISELLKKHKLPHNVLNARYHEQEAMIIAQAGRPGKITVATNMAGRGTDIMLGGNDEMLLQEEMGKKPNQDADALRKEICNMVEQDKKKVIDAGGLFVLCTERHDSRRIDDQLRGRSGRQGDPGKTKFYLSLEDELMRIFGSEKIASTLTRLGLKEGEAIVHPWISKSIEKAQQRVEARNFEMRKNLLRYDDVMNSQRSVIYEQRVALMKLENSIPTIKEYANELIEELISNFIPKNALPEQWDISGLNAEVTRLFSMELDLESFVKEEGIADEEVAAHITEAYNNLLDQKVDKYGAEITNGIIKEILLVSLDQLWKEHLHRLDYLKTGINLRAYAQKNPLNEYKMEAFTLFKEMLLDYKQRTVQRVALFQLATQADLDASDKANPIGPGKIGRNEPCPCGSSKKFKHCHGILNNR